MQYLVEIYNFKQKSKPFSRPHRYETTDGQRREEHGELRHIGTDHETIIVHGSYSWKADGVTYTVNYIADENGYQATGAHLPQQV